MVLKSAMKALIGLAFASSAPAAQLGSAGFADLKRRYTADCEAGRFSGVASVMIEGKVAFQHVCGLSDREAGVPLTFDSRFKIASITKPLTATAVMRLVEQKRLNLDAPVAAYLPDAPSAWRDVSLRHLLQHSSGIPEQIDALAEAYETDYGSAFFSVMAKLRAANAGPVTPPGSKFEYSNFNYELLGEIIARAVGLPFPEVLGRLVFQPAGMASASVEVSRLVDGKVAGAAEPGLARGYEGEPGALKRVEEDYGFVFRGSGSVHASLADFLAWDAAWSEGRLLSPESERQIWSEAFEIREGRKQALVGLVHDVGSTRIWYQWGAMDGFKPYFARAPEKRISVMILSNMDAVKPNVLGEELLTAALACLD